MAALQHSSHQMTIFVSPIGKGSPISHHHSTAPETVVDWMLRRAGSDKGTIRTLIRFWTSPVLMLCHDQVLAACDQKDNHVTHSILHLKYTLQPHILMITVQESQKLQKVWVLPHPSFVRMVFLIDLKTLHDV